MFQFYSRLMWQSYSCDMNNLKLNNVANSLYCDLTLEKLLLLQMICEEEKLFFIWANTFARSLLLRKQLPFFDLYWKWSWIVQIWKVYARQRHCRERHKQQQNRLILKAVIDRELIVVTSNVPTKLLIFKKIDAYLLYCFLVLVCPVGTICDNGFYSVLFALNWVSWFCLQW